MAKIKFEDGTVVNFEGNPTEQDIEEVASSLRVSKTTSKPKSQIKQDVQSVLGDNIASDIVSGVGQFGTGVGSSILKGGLGLAQTALKGVQKAKESPTASPLLRAIPNTQGAQQALSNVKQKFSDVYAPETKSIPGQAGNLTGEIAQYATGNATIVRGQQFLRGIADTALKNAPGVAKFAGRTASRVIPEAGISAGMEYAKSGGNAEQAKEAGTFAGVASGIFGALGDVYRTAFKPSTKESLQKALGVQGKQTASRALEDTDKKLEGFQVMKEYSPNIKIKDLDGVEKNFDPNNATFTDTLQAWEQSRKLAFKEYNDIAKKASGKGLEVDLQPVIDELLDANSQPASSQTKKAIVGAYNDLIENFTTVDDVGNRILIGDPERLETYIADLNKVARGVFQGTSDRATAEVAANVVSKLREIIDDAISQQGGGQYQVARNKYAALKSIENDLVRRFKQMNRKIGNGLYDYSDIFLSGDIISGIVANEPRLLVMGLTGKAVSSALKKMKDPERYLRQVFQGLDDATPPSLTKQRLFGGNKETPEYKAGTEMTEQAKKNLKNPSNAQGGFINLGGKSDELINEAKKYKSAGDFISEVNKNYSKYKDEIAKLDTSEIGFLGEIWNKANPKKAKEFVSLDIMEKIKRAGKREYNVAVKEVQEVSGEKMINGYIDIDKLTPTQYLDDTNLAEYKQLVKDDIAPIVVDYNGKSFDIYDGHHRLNAYRALGIKKVPITVNESAKSKLIGTWKKANK